MSALELTRNRTTWPMILNTGALGDVSRALMRTRRQRGHESYVRVKGRSDLHQADCKEQTNCDLSLYFHL